MNEVITIALRFIFKTIIKRIMIAMPTCLHQSSKYFMLYIDTHVWHSFVQTWNTKPRTFYQRYSVSCALLGSFGSSIYRLKSKFPILRTRVPIRQVLLLRFFCTLVIFSISWLVVLHYIFNSSLLGFWIEFYRKWTWQQLIMEFLKTWTKTRKFIQQYWNIVVEPW